jgi:tetratricopeptide (TPR) repeat protein
LAASIALGITVLLALFAGGVIHELQLRRLNNNLETVNTRLQEARSNAERNARDALAAITQMLVRLADQRLAEVPEAESVRRDLLNDALSRLQLLQDRSPTDPEIRLEMGRAHLGIAALHKALGELARAQDQCRLALGILDPLLAESPSSKNFKDTLAQAHLALAEWLAPDLGKPHFLRAVELWEPLARDDHAIRAKLAGCYFGVAAQKNGFGLASPSSFCERAMGLLEGLVGDHTTAHGHDLARAIYNLGLEQGRLGHTADAISQYRRALQTWQSIPMESRTEADQEGIASCQNALGLFLRDLAGGPEKVEAETMLRQAVDSYDELARRHPRRLAYRSGLSRSWSNLGSFYWWEHRNPEAEATYAKALIANDENVHDFPEVTPLLVLLAHGHQNLADARARLGKTREAREGFEKALSIIEPLVTKHPADYAVQECVGIVCLNYGNMVADLSGPEAALPLRKRCVAAFEKARLIEPDRADTRNFLKGAMRNLAGTFIALRRYDEALAQADSILPLCDPGEQLGERLARGLLLARMGRHEEAETEARVLEPGAGNKSEYMYNLACLYSLAVSAVRSDAHLTHEKRDQRMQSLSREALRLIKRSHREGKFPTKDLLDLLAKDSDLDAIRGTSEFDSLVTSLRH